MKIGRPAARYLSEIVADADLDMDGHKLTGLSAPADQNDSLRYGQAEIRNAEIAAAAEIVLSKLVDTYLLPTVMTTRGDLVYRAAEYPVRIAAGDPGKVLTMGANDPGWVALPTQVVIVHKASDETITNNNTLQNDDDLVIPVGINENWEFWLYLRINSHTDPDIKIAFAVPANGVAKYGKLDASITQEFDFTSTINLTTSGADQLIGYHGVYRGGDTAGYLQLQWAQQGLSAEETKVLAGSYLIAHKLN